MVTRRIIIEFLKVSWYLKIGYQQVAGRVGIAHHQEFSYLLI